MSIALEKQIKSDQLTSNGLVDSKTSKPIEYASVQLLANRFDSVTK